MLPIADLFGWSGEGDGLPVVADALEVAMVALGVTLLLMAFRFLALRFRARTPRVQVSSVTEAKDPATQAKGKTDDKQDDDQAWVDSLLREHLAALQLDPMEALPEASSGAPLVEIVEGVGEGIGDKSQLGRALGRLFRALVPEAAYEVSATVRASPNGGKGGTISLQVVDRTHRRGAFVDTVVSDGSWAECAQDAAATVAGALYPWVSDRHKGPWTQWRDPVPRELVMLHAQARRYEGEDRLEQAMGAYHEALDRDPLNPNLRLRIAMLQERLELNLGAWVTYRAIADESNRDAWKGTDRRVRLLALYRLAILLGNEGVAKSWMSTDRDPDENERRDELRASLGADQMLSGTSWLERIDRSFARRRVPAALTASRARRLLMDLHRADRASGRATAPDMEAWISERLPTPAEDAAAERSLAELLQIISLLRLEQLDARLRRKPPWRFWRLRKWWRYRPAIRHALRRREFSLSAVRVSKLIAQLRIIASAEEREGHLRAPREAGLAKRARLLRQWPFQASIARLPVRWLRPRHRFADRRDDAWQYHYNAACAVSIALELRMWPPGAKTSRQVEQGIKQLEEYTHRAGSVQVWAQADWVAHEDDDLQELRSTPEYKRWIDHHLPSRKVKVTTGTRQIDTGRIAARIAYGSACAFTVSWGSRVEAAPVAVETAARWWSGEATAWEKLATIASQHRSWHIRCEVIDTLQACLHSAGDGIPMDVAHRPRDREVEIGSSDEIVTALRGIACDLTPSGHYKSVGHWAKLQAERAASDRKEATTNGNGRKSSEVDLHEAQRAFRIWSCIAETLGEVLDEDVETPDPRMRKCLQEVTSELDGGHPATQPDDRTSP